jgi:hydroxymethylbilane synthase
LSRQSLLRIGSRGSKLALWQAEWVKARLTEQGHEAEIIIIRTKGDKILDVPLARIGGKGLFTKEIEDALLRDEIDLAVHSLKDLPTILPQGLTIAAMPQREDPRDVLVGATLASLPVGARVGTGSLRRAAQLRALRPDIQVLHIRGNVDTRIRKHEEGQYDALVMASAGLTRLGLQSKIGEYLDPTQFLPAVAQGALAIETRASGEAWQVARGLHDPRAAAAVTAERSLLEHLGGGCQVPLGAHAVLDEADIYLRAIVVSADGKQQIRCEAKAPIEEAESLGASLAQELLQAGAQQIVEQASIFAAKEGE